MLSKRLKVQPKGRVRGGFIAAAVDSSRGIVYCVGELSMRRWLVWSRRIPLRGTFHIPPEHLLSVNCRSGARIALGPLRIVVCDAIAADEMLAAVAYLNRPALRGQAVINVKDKYIDVRSITLRGHACGAPVDIYAK